MKKARKLPVELEIVVCWFFTLVCDRWDLLQAARVCRQWRTTFLPLIWREIQLHQSNIRRLLPQLIRNPHLTMHTRTLVLPGYKEPAATHDSQIIILGALNSLSSRDVKRLYAILCVLDTHVLSDDRIHYPRNCFPCPHPRGCTNRSPGFA